MGMKKWLVQGMSGNRYISDERGKFGENPSKNGMMSAQSRQVYVSCRMGKRVFIIDFMSFNWVIFFSPSSMHRDQI